MGIVALLLRDVNEGTGSKLVHIFNIEGYNIECADKTEKANKKGYVTFQSTKSTSTTTTRNTPQAGVITQYIKNLAIAAQDDTWDCDEAEATYRAYST
ncbi:hypothetical protein N7455_001026 [Penicillium solitum]|uniref:uncharacterized protein n=1 Tax=Penicillium solitum TaxID=60172 RepID=UPI0017DB5201|nr:hypothetical protein HAV15_007875 [Penicillium sp. str. \